MVQNVVVLSSLTLGAMVLATACSPSAAEQPRTLGDSSHSAAPKCDDDRPGTIDMSKLAWLGEKADGKRNKVFHLFIDKDGNPQLREKKEAGDCDTHVKVRTDALPDRTEVDTVFIRIKGDSAILPSDKDYDAVFWTESSVDKFVWPYYHSHRLWNDDIDSVAKKFKTTKAAFAVAHQAPSKPTIARPRQTRGIGTAAEELRIGVLEKGQVKWIDVDSFIKWR